MNKPNDTPYQQGLVISYFGSSVAVEVTPQQVFQCHLRRNQALPVVGDKVRFQKETGNVGVIVGIEPRSSSLTKGEGRGKTKVIAANVNTIVIVMAPLPVFSEYLVDRYLAASELLQIEPIIVLNKSDLLNEDALEQAKTLLKPYREIPYTVLLSSALSQDGLGELKSALKNKAAVLVGPSGVGKSSIIAGLTTDYSIRIGEVTPKGAGKHTTTVTRLYHMSEGGYLIDSPGVREFNLWPVNKQEILKGFKEFKKFLNTCKFRDCLHIVEPGCGVQAAVSDGKISPKRFASYERMIKEASQKK